MKLLLRSNLLAIISLLLVLSLYFGVRVADVADLLQLHQNPFHLLPNPDRQYLHGSIINPILGWLFFARDKSGINIFYYIVLIISWATIIFLAVKKFQTKSLFFILFLFSWPVLKVSIGWLGKSDSFFILGYSLIFFLRGYWRFFGGLILGLAHKELGLIVVVFEALYIWESGDRKNLALTFFGFISSLFFHYIYIHFGLDGIPVSRINFALNTLSMRLQYFYSYWYLFFLALLMPIFIIKKVHHIDFDSKTYLCICCAFIVAVLCTDTTRIFTLALLPTIFHLAENLTDKRKTNKINSISYLLPFIVFEVVAPPIVFLGRPAGYLADLFPNFFNFPFKP